MNVLARMATSVGLIAANVVLVASIALPTQAAEQKDIAKKEVDKTGLDFLCSGKEDLYIPPKNGISYCVTGGGKQVIKCDSKTDKCTSAREAKDSSTTINADAMTLHMLQQLSNKVDELTKQVQALAAARK